MSREFSTEHKQKLKDKWVERKAIKARESLNPIADSIKSRAKLIRSHKFSTVMMPLNLEKIDRKHYVTWGADNMYPEFMIQLKHRFALHRRCMVAKINATLGKGLIIENNDDQSLLEHANPKETWNEVFEKAVGDFVLFNGFALNVIWDETGTQISEIYHLPFNNIRSGLKNEDEEVHQYWYSPNWREHKINEKRYAPKAFTKYSKETAAAAVEEGKVEYLNQIFYFKMYDVGFDYYPTPTYDGAITNIQFGINIDTFQVSYVENGMVASNHIHFNNGEPAPEGIADLYEEINAAFSGGVNAGRFFLTFSEDKDHAAVVTPLKAENDGFFTTAQDKIKEMIAVAHGITSPLLIGLRDIGGGGGLGNNKDEINIAYQRFLFSTIRPEYQKPMLKGFNQMLDGFGYPSLKLAIIPEVIFDEDANISVDDNNTDTNTTNNQNE